MADRRLEGRRAVVVHVGSELGRAAARQFAAAGADVLLIDPLDDVLVEVADHVRTQTGARVRSFRADFGDETHIEAAVAFTAAQWPHLDVLFVGAGAFDWWPVDDDTIANWEAAFRVNFFTPAFYTKRFAEMLTRSQRGSVIYYGSIDGIHGNPRIPAYSAARGALIPYTHVMAHTLGPAGVRVNYIAGAAAHPLGPDAATPRGAISNPRESIRATPLGRRALAEEVATTALFLASDDSRYITGTVITHDGGRLAITPGTHLLPDIGP